MTAFTGQQPTPPISTFLRSTTGKPVTVKDVQRERCFHIQNILKASEKLHPVVKDAISENRERSRRAASRGELPNFEEGDYVLVAREEFFAGEKLALRWRGPRQVVKVLNDYVYRVEDLRNSTTTDVHGSRLKFYSDRDLNKPAIMPHVVHSETGMEVARLMSIIERDGDLFVQVR